MDFNEVRAWLRDLGYFVEEQAMARFRVERDGVPVGVLMYVGETGVLRTNASLERISQRCIEQAQLAVESSRHPGTHRRI